MHDKKAVEQEALETYKRFTAERDRVDEGEQGWEVMADFFTEDAVYIDPAWGRQEGRETIREFFVASMAALTGHGWTSPKRWTMLDGHRIVSHWDQVIGGDNTDQTYAAPGLSILYYAGDGLFCYSHDYLNMMWVNEILRDMAWRPPSGFNMPPEKPVWHTDLPAAWQHLPDAFTEQGV
ncbi:MAG: nuclear transport factor 2 family protein [Pseudomonadota bacterium]